MKNFQCVVLLDRQISENGEDWRLKKMGQLAPALCVGGEPVSLEGIKAVYATDSMVENEKISDMAFLYKITCEENLSRIANELEGRKIIFAVDDASAEVGRCLRELDSSILFVRMENFSVQGLKSALWHLPKKVVEQFGLSVDVEGARKSNTGITFVDEDENRKKTVRIVESLLFRNFEGIERVEDAEKGMLVYKTADFPDFVAEIEFDSNGSRISFGIKDCPTTGCFFNLFMDCQKMVSVEGTFASGAAIRIRKYELAPALNELLESILLEKRTFNQVMNFHTSMFPHLGDLRKETVRNLFQKKLDEEFRLQKGLVELHADKKEIAYVAYLPLVSFDRRNDRLTYKDAKNEMRTFTRDVSKWKLDNIRRKVAQSLHAARMKLRNRNCTKNAGFVCLRG